MTNIQQIEHNEAFAGMIDILHSNHDRLVRIYETEDPEEKLALVHALVKDNRQLYHILQAVWTFILTLVHQRDAAHRDGTNDTLGILSNNIENKFRLDNDQDHGKGRIILDFISGHLDDPVWDDDARGAMHYLYLIADYVMEYREEQAAIQAGQGSEVA